MVNIFGREAVYGKEGPREPLGSVGSTDTFGPAGPLGVTMRSWY